VNIDIQPVSIPLYSKVKVEDVRLTQVPKDPLENFYDESINKYKIEDLKLRKGEGLPDDVQCDCKEVSFDTLCYCYGVLIRDFRYKNIPYVS
jgi:hypothetical protein